MLAAVSVCLTRRICAGLGTLLLLAPWVPARAAEPVPAQGTADELFEEAKQLMAASRFEEACRKFAESSDLDPGIGVLFYLGDCYEKSGKIASAWSAYKDALRLSTVAGQLERQQVASQRIAELETRLSRLVIEVAVVTRMAPEVRRDGHVVSRALWGAELPIDPGSHEILAQRSGALPWSTTVDVPPDGARVIVVRVPQLEALPSPAAPRAMARVPPVEPAALEPRLYTQHILSLSAFGLGAAGAVVGTVFGLRASSSWQDAQDHCRPGTPRFQCDSRGLSLIEDTKSQGAISTGAFVVGGAALVTGLTLWLTAPEQQHRRESGGRAPCLAITSFAGLEPGGPEGGLSVTGEL